jgi:t-SNARE complex subunit (syntaxin)
MTLIEMLRANGSWEADAAVTAIQVRDNRIEKLEAALARIAKYDTQAIAMDALRPGERIREKKDD